MISSRFILSRIFKNIPASSPSTTDASSTPIASFCWIARRPSPRSSFWWLRCLDWICTIAQRFQSGNNSYFPCSHQPSASSPPDSRIRSFFHSTHRLGTASLVHFWSGISPFFQKFDDFCKNLLRKPPTWHMTGFPVTAFMTVFVGRGQVLISEEDFYILL